MILSEWKPGGIVHAVYCRLRFLLALSFRLCQQASALHMTHLIYASHLIRIKGAQ